MLIIHLNLSDTEHNIAFQQAMQEQIDICRQKDNDNHYSDIDVDRKIQPYQHLIHDAQKTPQCVTLLGGFLTNAKYALAHSAQNREKCNALLQQICNLEQQYIADSTKYGIFT